MSVIPIRRLYDAKLFRAGEWKCAGTLCGHIDIATPACTFNLSPDEVQSLIVALTNARTDVLANSDPFGDPRIYGIGDPA